MAKDRQKGQTGGTKTANPISDEDLEEYGVWVKAEPQDIPEAASDSPEEAPFEIPVMDIPSDMTEVSEESFLTEEEESLLGSVDSGYSEDTEEISVEEVDFSIDEASGTDSFERKPGKSLPPKEALSFNADEDFSLDDIPEMSDSLSPGVQDNPGEEELSIEDFGISETLGSEESSIPGETEVSFDEFNGGESSAGETEEVGDISEPIDLDLEFDDTIETEPVGKRSGPSRSSSVETEEVTDFDDFLKENEAPLTARVSEEAEGKKKSGAKDMKEKEFDDVAAFESELSSDVSAKRGGGGDLSTSLLMKIAEELGSIKEELSTLRSQLVSIKQERPAESAQESISEESKRQEAGFFEEEEDETIALTGDELDNILNTADFTEEAGEAQAGESLSEDLIQGMLSEAPDIVAETEAPMEEIHLDETPRAVKLPKKEASKNEELSQFLEEGVEPMTSAPEDTSYLDEEEETVLGDISLEEAPLEEPDLSSISLEPSDRLSDESVDLGAPSAEMAEETAQTEEVRLGDLTLDIGDEAEELSLATEEPLAEELSLDTYEELTVPKLKTDEISLADETREDKGAKLVGQTLEPAALEEDIAEFAPAESLPEIEELVSEGESEMPEFLSHDVETVDEAPAEIEMEFSPRASEVALPSLDEELVPDLSEAGEEIPLSDEVVLEDDAEMIGGGSISIHPDDISMNLRDELFVGEPGEIPASKAKEDRKAEAQIPGTLKDEIKSVLAYMDRLLESLPEEKIEEFAKSEHFEIYKKLFEELGLV